MISFIGRLQSFENPYGRRKSASVLTFLWLTFKINFKSNLYGNEPPNYFSLKNAGSRSSHFALLLPGGSRRSTDGKRTRSIGAAADKILSKSASNSRNSHQRLNVRSTFDYYRSCKLKVYSHQLFFFFNINFLKIFRTSFNYLAFQIFKLILVHRVSHQNHPNFAQSDSSLGIRKKYI